MSRVTNVMSHIIGVRKKADLQKRVGEVKSLGNPDLTDSLVCLFVFTPPLSWDGGTE